MISVYYRAPDGSEPVKEYIERLSPEAQAKIHQHIDRLNEFGETLDYPHTSQVKGELRELRAWFGRTHYRIYFRRSGHFAILLHIINKRGERLPAGDNAIAEQRWEDFKARMDAQERTPPRAMGSDAP